ncbi:DUF6048 family protein [uncultured Marixanthomonas sp.]|uniref:DUF6048 family protein n=1 Tax=uncultured Marixanthomonas sp. TaxID=757245 RepID=UPI0030D9FD23
MKTTHILLFYISVFCVSFSTLAQEDIEKEEAVLDSTVTNNKYGIRVGTDLSKFARTAFEKGYSGFELMGDFRVTEKFYAAAEIGNEKKERFEDNLNSITTGSYAKLGFDYNAYNNWIGMENAIFAGLRYGFSTFKQELLSYQVYTTNQDFPQTFKENPVEYKGLTGHWLELIVGIKTEILNNLYLSVNLQLKRKLGEDEPDNFGNLYIPGFNRTYDFSEFGVGYGYTISYLIPIFKK